MLKHLRQSSTSDINWEIFLRRFFGFARNRWGRFETCAWPLSTWKKPAHLGGGRLFWQSSV